MMRAFFEYNDSIINFDNSSSEAHKITYMLVNAIEQNIFYDDKSTYNDDIYFHFYQAIVSQLKRCDFLNEIPKHSFHANF